MHGITEQLDNSDILLTEISVDFFSSKNFENTELSFPKSSSPK